MLLAKQKTITINIFPNLNKFSIAITIMITPLWIQILAILKRFYIQIRNHYIGSLFVMVLWPGFYLTIAIIVILKNDISSSQGAAAKITLQSVSYILMIFLTGYGNKYYVEWLVRDRACGMKSMMLLMGLRRSAYYLGHSICYLSCLSPVILTMLIISKLYVFNELPLISLILLYLIFTIQLTSQLFVCVSLITSVDMISLVMFITILQIPLHYLFILLMDLMGPGSHSIMLFFGSMFPFESYRLFADSYVLCSYHCDKIELFYEHSMASVPLNTLLIFMSFWSIFGLLFARWFEEVNPWQTDTAIKGPFFFISDYLGKKTSNLDDHLELTSQTKSKFFEETNTHNSRDIGIKIRNLTKTFNDTKPAVDDLSFDVFEGETTLLLGHNGAGKTTLMNIITGKLSSTTGQIKFKSKHGENYNYTQDRSGNVGICPQFSILDGELTVKEHLNLFIDIKAGDMNKVDREKHILETLKDVTLNEEVDKKASELSGGMQRKLSLAIAFIGQSNVLILDEPSSGLDPDSRIYVWNAIRKYRASKTVLLSTQHMEEADYLGDRIAIMSNGKIICCGSSIFLVNTLGNCYKLRVESFKSNEDSVLILIRKYFSQASIISTISTSPLSSSSPSESSKVSLVIELKGTDGVDEDLEENLINMLEYFESLEHEEKLKEIGIESYSLKSSSIEDVMINTSEFEDQPDSKIVKSDNGVLDNSSFKLKITTTNETINTLLTTSPNSYPTDDNECGSIKVQITLLKALLIKQLQVYRKDLPIIIFAKFILGLIALLFLNCNFLNMFITSQYKPSFLICYLILHFVHYPVQERTTKFKIIQLTTKLNILTYWLGHLIMDLAYLFIMIMVNLLMFSVIFNGNYIASKSTVLFIISLSMLFFGTSAAILAYYLSLFFTDLKKAPGQHLLFYWMGSIASFVINILALIWLKFYWLHNIADYIFIFIIPGDAFQFIMSGLVAECYIGSKQTSDKVPCINEEKFSRILIGFLALILQAIVYGTLLYMRECNNGNDRSLYEKMKTLLFRKSNTSSSFHPPSLSIDDNNSKKIDDDVLNESSKASQSIAQCRQFTNGDLVLIANELNKSYKKGTKVIDNLSFTVNRGECFGLLGINGAGKSTTFSMLTNDEITHDSGQMCILNSFEPKVYRKQIGYTPQTNPENVMTPSELFHLMARLRGVEEKLISRLVKALLDLLQMEEHSNKKCKELSGGTKRKLTLGMSLVGNSSLVILDEPTAGVDPIARVDVWSLLKALKNQNNMSVLISSHAMEECEAICDRIAIMASGSLRCIGTFLHLRSKFSQASRLRVQVTKSDNIELEDYVKVIVEELSEIFDSRFSKQVKLVDTNMNSATFNIINGSVVQRSVLFKLLREFKRKHNNIYYMFNDSSLEDIFIALAQEQQNKNKS